MSDIPTYLTFGLCLLGLLVPLLVAILVSKSRPDGILLFLYSCSNLVILATGLFSSCLVLLLPSLSAACSINKAFCIFAFNSLLLLLSLISHDKYSNAVLQVDTSLKSLYPSLFFILLSSLALSATQFIGPQTIDDDRCVPSSWDPSQWTLLSSIYLLLLIIYAMIQIPMMHYNIYKFYLKSSTNKSKNKTLFQKLAGRVFFFLFLWVPLLVKTLIEMVSNQPVPPVAEDIVYLFIYLHSIIDPLLTILVDNRISSQIRDMIPFPTSSQKTLKNVKDQADGEDKDDQVFEDSRQSDNQDDIVIAQASSNELPPTIILER